MDKLPAEVKKVIPQNDEKKKFLKLLKKYDVSDSSKLDGNFSLYLDMETNKKGVSGFLKDVKDLTLDKLKVKTMKKVSVTGVSMMSSKEIKTLNDFLAISGLSKLEVLYLNGGLNFKCEKVEEIITSLGKVTTEQIYIDSFVLEDLDLKVILKNSSKVKNLCIINCAVQDLDSDFSVDGSKSYKLKTLDLYWTAQSNNSEYLDQDKTKALLKAIGDSKIKDSLQNIHVCETDYSQDELEDLTRKLKLKVRVKADGKQPEPLD